jgi:hypothetical protein
VNEHAKPKQETHMKPQSNTGITVKNIEGPLARESMVHVLRSCFAKIACAQGGVAVAMEEPASAPLAA